MIHPELEGWDVRLTDNPVRLPIRLSSLSSDEVKSLRRLADISDERADGVLLRRNRRHNVGRCVVAGWNISVAPTFDSTLLLGLVLYAARLDLRLIEGARHIAATSAGGRIDLFAQMLAAVLVAEAEKLSRRHISQAWEPVIERSHNPKGRILWAADFGQPPRKGVTHLHRLKTTDTALNRLVRAGVQRASQTLAGTVLQGDASRQVFVWRELAKGIDPDPSDFDSAAVRLDRLTEHYRSALALSRAITLGIAPQDYFSPGPARMLPGLIFSLPSIFESFLEQLLREIAASVSGLEVASQEPDRQALIDEYGAAYRSIRPDLELRRDGVPVAVVDAKFKPTYSDAVGPERMSNEDIYQLLFYQARIAERSGRQSLPAAVVAPQLGHEPLSDRWPRQVAWRRAGEVEHRVHLVTVPIAPLLEALRDRPAKAALFAAPDLQAFLDREWIARPPA